LEQPPLESSKNQKSESPKKKRKEKDNNKIKTRCLQMAPKYSLCQQMMNSPKLFARPKRNMYYVFIYLLFRPHPRWVQVPQPGIKPSRSCDMHRGSLTCCTPGDLLRHTYSHVFLPSWSLWSEMGWGSRGRGAKAEDIGAVRKRHDQNLHKCYKRRVPLIG